MASKRGTYMGFDKLKADLAQRRNVKDPSALAAYVGRKKYGKKPMARQAAKAQPFQRPHGPA